MQELLHLYIESHDLSCIYVQCLKRTVKRAMAAGIRSVSDLTPANVNRFLAGQDVSQTTRCNYRRAFSEIVKPS